MPLSGSSGVNFSGQNELREIARHRSGQPGPHILTIKNEGTHSVLLSLLRSRLGVESAIAADEESQVALEATTYVPDGSTQDFTGDTLDGDAIAPGSVVVEATTTSPALTDPNGDGKLYNSGVGASKQADSGSFAAMASESMVVKVDGGPATTVTFGTEATIGAAAAVITAALGGATATPQGAEDVDIDSDSVGPGSSIEVLQVDAGITTKLGISTGLATAEAGTIDYYSGAIDLAYQGYAPTDDGPGFVRVSYKATVEVDPETIAIFRVANLQLDDELIVKARGDDFGGKVIVDINPVKAA